MGQKEQRSLSLPRGITLRQHKTGSTLVMTFTYKGLLCREPLSLMDVNTKTIKYAERLLGEIQNKIAAESFAYIDYFPHSRKLKIFGSITRRRAVIDYLDEYLTICKNRNLSPSTLVGYKKCCSVLSALHKLPVTSLTPAILKNWISQQKTTLKTTRNRLSFLRSALDEAVTDGLIEVNPVKLVSAARYQTSRPLNSGRHYEVDPFSPAEATAIYIAAGNKQWENLFRFAFHTGMRSSELCALRWEDIDFTGKRVNVKSASVVGVIKETKTKAGRRSVDLDTEALTALEEQKPFTLMRSKFVFDDPKTGAPWAGADAIRKKAWVLTLQKAGIRYRNPYQTRHTFATRHISRGANLFWLAAQMGHKGPEMLFRHYGAYLSDYDGNAGRDFNVQ
ncbi:tyrosine-type recombinase/integrase [Dickeya fangzhongdai]|uniref:tyrosine-type recombinase/integrase n=1 Tax=Dickeya fangzhongdai TaxID=1778540 RepID=UPI0026DF0881|nr:tyrosine-type recombinase/integrase [Dickeya fangzhongdai]WKV52389.1 tyrosine-type recombinase/integrase [Dickeya fangzhongdai]